MEAQINSPTSSLIELNKHSSNTSSLWLSQTFSPLAFPQTPFLLSRRVSCWLFALHTFDLTIMVLRISLENTQSMLIESSSHSGSIPYYALDQLHRDGGPGRSMYLTQVAVDSLDTDIDGVTATQILWSPPLCCTVLHSGLVKNHQASCLGHILMYSFVCDRTSDCTFMCVSVCVSDPDYLYLHLCVCPSVFPRVSTKTSNKIWKKVLYSKRMFVLKIIILHNICNSLWTIPTLTVERNESSTLEILGLISENGSEVVLYKHQISDTLEKNFGLKSM